jgi:hypothetical protein
MLSRRRFTIMTAAIAVSTIGEILGLVTTRWARSALLGVRYWHEADIAKARPLSPLLTLSRHLSQFRGASHEEVARAATRCEMGSFQYQGALKRVRKEKAAA